MINYLKVKNHKGIKELKLMDLGHINIDELVRTKLS